MTTPSVILVGGPDSGKTNYLARLWKALRGGGGLLHAPEIPSDIEYVEDALSHLLMGSFAPRSNPDLAEGRTNFSVPVQRTGDNGRVAQILVPDVTGEVWKAAVAECEISVEWMNEMDQAYGALLFIRVHSDLNVSNLDWVTAERLLSSSAAAAVTDEESQATPTQVVLCELLRFLELRLKRRPSEGRARVAVMITAWDLLDKETAKAGPLAFLRSQYPLFSGRIADIESLETRVFGVSVVGGDLGDDAFKNSFLEGDQEIAGYVVRDAAGGVEKRPDMTLPVAWLLEGLL